MRQRRLLFDGMPLEIKARNLSRNDPQAGVLAFFVTHVEKKVQALRHPQDRPTLIDRPHERRNESTISDESHRGSKRRRRWEHHLGTAVQAID
jgi:hypothetical protein